MKAGIQVKAVLFDIDDTAVPSGFEGRPSDNLKQIIQQAQDRLHMSAATGRSWDVAHQVLGELGLTDPCIIGGGTLVVNPRTQEILWQATMPNESVALVARVAAKYGHEVVFTKGLETKHQDPQQLQPVDDINVMYILGVPTDQVQPMMDELSADPSITAALAGSWLLPETGMDFHITSSTATKEHAVHELCRILGITASETVGVGDGFNDIHLFNAVGHKVAMGNAVPELKAAADEVIGSIGDDGLAKYIARLI